MAVVAVGWAMSREACSAVLTVGSGGSHVSFQDAVNTAFLNPGADEIRLLAGTFTGSTVVNGNLSGNDVLISGSWEPGFVSQGLAPTVLDGMDAAFVLNVDLAAGRLELDRLTITRGFSVAQTGGLDLLVTGSAQVVGTRLRVFDSRAASGRAACVAVNSNNDAVVQLMLLDLEDCRNERLNTASGAALHLTARGRSRISVLESTARTARTVATSVTGGALSVNANGEAQVLLTGMHIQDSAAEGSTVFGSALAISAQDTAGVHVDALDLHDNLAPLAAAGTAQLAISASGSALVRIGSTLIHSGPQQAVSATAIEATTRVHLGQLTLVSHAGRALQFFGSGQITLHNSIAQDNGLPSALPAGAGSNNLGADLGLPAPTFVDAPNGNYRLATGSAGIDAGLGTPPGGLPLLDLDRRERLQGGATDIGAYENVPDAVFRNAFES